MHVHTTSADNRFQPYLPEPKCPRNRCIEVFRVVSCYRNIVNETTMSSVNCAFYNVD